MYGLVKIANDNSKDNLFSFEDAKRAKDDLADHDDFLSLADELQHGYRNDAGIQQLGDDRISARPIEQLLSPDVAAAEVHPEVQGSKLKEALRGAEQYMHQHPVRTGVGVGLAGAGLAGLGLAAHNQLNRD